MTQPNHNIQQESSSIGKAANLDLTNCRQESVHISDSIQPHGVLLGLQEPDLSVVLMSQNVQTILGIDPQDLMNQALSEFAGSDVLHSIRKCLEEDFDSLNPLTIRLQTSTQVSVFHGIVHRSDGLVILELEAKTGLQDTGFFVFYRLVKATMTKVQKTQTLQELCQVVVADIRKLTGFDRVMVYRFNTDYSGTVVAEDKKDGLEPYLGLYYPATDIPFHSRRLYELNWLRIIPDIGYDAVPLSQSNNPLTDAPLDLSYSILRDGSPCHLEYLKNMGVRASMAISLLKQGKLWGLIACHHTSAKYVDYEVRTACEFLGQAMSLELVAKENNEDLEYKVHLRSVQSHLIDQLSMSDDFVDSLMMCDDSLLSLTGASGAAIYAENDWKQIGQTPSQPELMDLLGWVEPRIEDDIYYTNSLSRDYAVANSYQTIASGLIVLAITRIRKNYILWFRPEVLQSITWAGDPDKSTTVQDDGSLSLTPRKSFEQFQETVRGTSLPWKQCEIDGVYVLKQAIIGIVLRRADALAEMNLQLTRSNDDLDAFAYIASHDLKQPLRGIHNYSNFLLEDYADVLEGQGAEHLQSIAGLTQRMEQLIDSLLYYSRLGKTELKYHPLNVNDLVTDILNLVHINFPNQQIEISTTHELPVIWGDRIQINEVFTNLIVNAVKYNTSDIKRIEIGSLAETDSNDSEEFVTLYVRDNGIGIHERHYENIFRIFRRLHKPSKYGGGTGAGLTIVARIIERHGGSIWVESTPGNGSTFYIKLPAQLPTKAFSVEDI